MYPESDYRPDNDDDDDNEEELQDALADDKRMFTFADVALAMRRGVRLGFVCGYELMRDVADDDMQKREVVERPLVLQRLRHGFVRWMEYVDEQFKD